MVEPCARVDVLVARLGRVERVVRIVHLPVDINDKTLLIIVHVFFAKENVQIGQMMIR